MNIMTQYLPYSVKLTNNQKVKLAKALQNNSPIVLRLTKNNLIGNDELMLTKTQVNKIKKSISTKKGVDLKISKTQVSKVVQHGSSIFASLAGLGAKLLPTVTNVATKVLPGLASGAIHSLGNFSMDKILRNGMQNRGYGMQNRQSGGFLIPQNKIDKLIQHKNLLTKTQKEQILNALQTGGQVIIKPTKTQRGGVIGSLLAAVGVPMLLKAVTGSGMQNRTVPYYGRGQKKTTKKGKGLILGKNSPFSGIPLLGDIL